MVILLPAYICTQKTTAMHTAVTIAHWGIVGLSLAAALASDLHVVLADGVWLGGVMIHWLCNDNTCALTILEKYLRGVDDKNSFFFAVASSIFSPQFANQASFWIVWAVTAALFAICISRSFPILQGIYAKMGVSNTPPPYDQPPASL